MALTAVTTPPLPFRASNEPSARWENVTGPLFEAIIKGRDPKSTFPFSVEVILGCLSSAGVRSGMIPPSARDPGQVGDSAPPAQL